MSTTPDEATAEAAPLEPPDTYCCTSCGASGVKLWRETAAMATDVHLLCASCLSQEGTIPDISRMNVNGQIDDGYGLTDCFGIYLPAVPVFGTNTYWQYSRVPAQEARWWRALPNAAA